MIKGQAAWIIKQLCNLVSLLPIYYTILCYRYNSQFVGYVKQKVFGAATKMNPSRLDPLQRLSSLEESFLSHSIQ